jgi:hypothetical protein
MRETSDSTRHASQGLVHVASLFLQRHDRAVPAGEVCGPGATFALAPTVSPGGVIGPDEFNIHVRSNLPF